MDFSKSPLLLDIQRTYDMLGGSFFSRALACMMAPGVHAVIVYRFGRWSRGMNFFVRLLFDPIYFFLNFFVKILWGIELPRGVQAGPGLYIGHFGGLIISSATIIGRNCNISQGVTIGVSGGDGKGGVPRIGDDVYIAPGAKIFGPISIGRNVKIGANAVVYKDIPDNAVVVLDPGFRILSFSGNRKQDLNLPF